MNTSDFAQRLADKLIAQLGENGALAKAVDRGPSVRPVQPDDRQPVSRN